MKQISEVEEETVHVVFKYLSRSLLWKGVGAGGITPLLLSWSVDISIKDDLTVILLLRLSFMS
jgi:hypothetical protein